MPFQNEYASGESLLALQASESLRNFEGTIAQRSPTMQVLPLPANIPRRSWLPHRVVAIDGSNIVKRIENGFPGAEAGLVLISVVFIDIMRLASLRPGDIPPPRLFHDMERASTVDTVLPGANVIRASVGDDTPQRYFRQTVYNTLLGSITQGHETLLDTLHAITANRSPNIRCPIEDCTDKYLNGCGEYPCACGKDKLFETDALRFHERFNEIGSNGEVHGEVRHVLEILVLLNILRFFAHEQRAFYLKNCSFVLDGPLAVFGQPAWIAPYVKAELKRIHSFAERRNDGEGLLLLGLEKGGQFMTHFEDIDWTDENGPRSRFPCGTVILPDARYINQNIVFRPEDAKPHGIDTYFGRKVLYKTQAGDHVVLNTAIVNNEGDDFHNISIACFPRLGDVLNIMDHLSTYLYEDGFMPLVRAHAHAAIPLQRGGEILQSLFATRT